MIRTSPCCAGERVGRPFDAGALTRSFGIIQTKSHGKRPWEHINGGSLKITQTALQRRADSAQWLYLFEEDRHGKRHGAAPATLPRTKTPTC
jgi:hypothetical protein